MFQIPSAAGERLALRITVAGKSDRGLVRTGNEDSFRVDTENNLFIVCDGMGGHQAGEVASKEACEIMSYGFTQAAEQMVSDPALQLSAQFPPRGDLLIKSIRLANLSVYIRSRSRSEYSGMGTTVVAAAIDDSVINIAHVGDSRAYRLDGNGLRPLTTDHSWVSELKQSGQFSAVEAEQIVGKNVITRALGVNKRVEVDFRADRLRAGEIYILCTDGLCGYADDSDIYAAAKSCDKDVQKIVDTLIQLANDRGGQDNVTVIAIRVDEVPEETSAPETSPVTIGIESDEALMRENEILEGLTKRAERTQEVAIQLAQREKGFSLALLFAIFIIIAVLAIYFVGSR
jgi:protein phosphatase